MSRLQATRSSVAMVTTFAPTRCGIARFSASLKDALAEWGQPVDIFRLVEGDNPHSPGPDVVMEFNPSKSPSVEIARQALRRYQAVIVQHEFGIYGPDDGESVLHLIRDLPVPLVVVIHTVPNNPSPAHTRILAELDELATVLVAPSEAARLALERVFGFSPDRVTVLPHGSSWLPSHTSSGERSKILTWGLLGPGKGVERALRAVAELSDLRPLPTFRVVGETHPNVVRQQGNAYRDSLHQLARDLGLEGQVEFDDGYKSDSDLYQLVAEADVVVIPYDNAEQICSGVLTEAIAAGKPVVATNFPHASELLATGAGSLVEHDDAHGFSQALRTFLTNDIAYQRAVHQAHREAHRLSWGEVARRYNQVLAQLTLGRSQESDGYGSGSLANPGGLVRSNGVRLSPL